MSGPLASWSSQRSGIVAVVNGGSHFLFPEDAKALADSLLVALSGDDDPTPRMGNDKAGPVLQAVRSAWKRFSGDMVHGVDCPAKDGEVGGAARTADARCSCGLRPLVLALEGH